MQISALFFFYCPLYLGVYNVHPVACGSLVKDIDTYLDFRTPFVYLLSFSSLGLVHRFYIAVIHTYLHIFHCLIFGRKYAHIAFERMQKNDKPF